MLVRGTSCLTDSQRHLQPSIHPIFTLVCSLPAQALPIGPTIDTMPANFRSYEGQLRLLTAVIAAHPELRLNYKDIASHYGSDWSVSGIDHFFRPIKRNSKAIRGLVKRGEDPADFNHNAIHKYFGDSTPDGIQFQFRGIKKDAENLRQGKGVPTAPSTPGGSRNNPQTPRTTGGRKRAATSTGKSTANKKSKSAVKLENTYEIDDDSEIEDPPLDITPSKSLVNEDKMRAYEQILSETAPRFQPPDLAPAQAASPDDDDEDVKIVTPADVAHSFEPTHSFTTGSGYHPHTFFNNTHGDIYNKSYTEDAFDEC
ncbi:hypothetical protein N0V93_006271 [Gnomoniopsis smithogilvyi]|uniref:Uncharacterized protein n=1 Tax=Gnomoniopsis smithogilvyi TaxID=1191159 RepID=A0A9W8YQH2_9PEZI|nr:hypothetical protein N0V93_006271 [Gnomoniopsis smithogilvyi]